MAASHLAIAFNHAPLVELRTAFGDECSYTRSKRMGISFHYRLKEPHSGLLGIYYCEVLYAP